MTYQWRDKILDSRARESRRRKLFGAFLILALILTWLVWSGNAPFGDFWTGLRSFSLWDKLPFT